MSIPSCLHSAHESGTSKGAGASAAASHFLGEVDAFPADPEQPALLASVSKRRTVRGPDRPEPEPGEREITGWLLAPGSPQLTVPVIELESLRSHWSELMAALLRIRMAYLLRFPTGGDGMTLGDVGRLSTLALAVASYPLLKGQARVANGQLHPVLCAMFHMSNAVRVAADQMLFLAMDEPVLSADTVVTGEALQALAEHEALQSGACPAPLPMVSQFLRVLVDGADNGAFTGVALPVAVQDALQDVQPAFDYALLGMQALAAVYSLQPLMTRTYTRMAQIVDGWTGVRTPSLLRLEEHVRERARIVQGSPFLTTEGCASRERICAELYAKCSMGLGDPVRQSLSARLGGKAGHGADASENLRAVLRRHFAPGAANDNLGIEWLVDCLMHCFQRTQEVLGLACELQQRIDDLLGREPPARPFSTMDLGVHRMARDEESLRLPYVPQLPHLLHELDQLGIRVKITCDDLEIGTSRGS